MQKQKIIKPLFKYIGGKSWLRDELRKEIGISLANKKLTIYVEPFAGGLGSFLSVYDVLVENGVKSVKLSDINFCLINTYKYIMSDAKGLTSALLLLENKFLSSVPNDWNTSKDKEEIKNKLALADAVFRSVKKDFNLNKNSNSLEQSARLIFLQKHSFNGVYRENLKGEYNTPFNWSGNTMQDTIGARIDELSEVFKSFDIEFIHTSYEGVVYNNESLYYLDPPYINENIGENKYNKDEFGLKEQLDLIDRLGGLSFVYSNHYSEILLETFKKKSEISVRKVNRKNIMSASAESRKTDSVEMLVSSVIKPEAQ